MKTTFQFPGGGYQALCRLMYINIRLRAHGETEIKPREQRMEKIGTWPEEDIAEDYGIREDTHRTFENPFSKTVAISA